MFIVHCNWIKTFCIILLRKCFLRHRRIGVFVKVMLSKSRLTLKSMCASVLYGRPSLHRVIYKMSMLPSRAVRQAGLGRGETPAPGPAGPLVLQVRVHGSRQPTACQRVNHNRSSFNILIFRSRFVKLLGKLTAKRTHSRA